MAHLQSTPWAGGAFKCVANKKENEGAGTTPKFYCSVPVWLKTMAISFVTKSNHIQGPNARRRNGEILVISFQPFFKSARLFR